MTPDQERALLDATRLGLDDDLREAYKRMLDLIRSGVPAVEAVDSAMAAFTGQYADLLAEGFSAVLAMSVGTESVLDIQVGPVKLSQRLYAHSQSTGAVVRGIVERHAKGFQDAKRLTLEIYEGYGFRADEPLKISPQNRDLPRYLRDELLRDKDLRGELARHFARVQASTIRTASLRASYLEYIDALESGAGWKVLEKKLDTAFYERTRYFANRIAQTELHRAYSLRDAAELDGDQDVEWVQWRMSPSHPETDICDYFAGVNRYGMGRGVYPKGQAPVAPAHPHCRCVLSPRLDLTGRTPGKFRTDADGLFINSLTEQDAARVAGSRAKLDEVKRGRSPWGVHNSTIDLQYQVKTLDQSVREFSQLARTVSP